MNSCTWMSFMCVRARVWMCVASCRGSCSLWMFDVTTGVRRGSGVPRSRGCALTYWGERGTDEGDSLMFVLSIALLRGIFCLTVCGASILLGSSLSVSPDRMQWLSLETACVRCLGEFKSWSEAMHLEGHFSRPFTPKPGRFRWMLHRLVYFMDGHHMLQCGDRKASPSQVLGKKPSDGCFCQVYFLQHCDTGRCVSVGSSVRHSCRLVSQVQCHFVMTRTHRWTYSLNCFDNANILIM